MEMRARLGDMMGGRWLDIWLVCDLSVRLQGEVDGMMVSEKSRQGPDVEIYGRARAWSVERDFLARRESTMPRDDVESPAGKMQCLAWTNSLGQISIDDHSSRIAVSGGGDYSRIEDDS